MASVAVQSRARALGAVGLGVLCVSQFVDVLSVNTAVIALPDTAMSIALLLPLASAAGDTVTGVRVAFAVSAAIAAAGGVATLVLLRRSD